MQYRGGNHTQHTHTTHTHPCMQASTHTDMHMCRQIHSHISIHTPGVAHAKAHHHHYHHESLNTEGTDPDREQSVSNFVQSLSLPLLPKLAGH